jgi:integrase
MSHNVGIEIRHSKTCPAREGANCRCKPTYQASVWSARDNRRIRRTFPTPSAAKTWRADAMTALHKGTMRAPSSLPLRHVANVWLEGAREGTIRTRSGDAYKPSAIRGYQAALNNRLLPALGAKKLADVRRADLQDFADSLLAAGLDPSTIRNSLMPLRAIYRRALARGDVGINPTAGLELPAVRGQRDRIASPEEAVRLLEGLPTTDRSIWATATYAGLRLGELMALRFEDVDLAAGLIRVERSYDPKEGAFITPKSRAGRRVVPIPAVLREYLAAHKLRLGRSSGLFFGRTGEKPFNGSSLAARAKTSWKDAEPALTPITLHEARHTFASLMIAAGVNAKALSTYMGHSSVTITFDRYGHLMPGNEGEAADLLDAFLARAEAPIVAPTVARIAQTA